MPWGQRQWRAIAADMIRRHGRVEGERRLRELKRKHGTVVLKNATRGKGRR